MVSRRDKDRERESRNVLTEAPVEKSHLSEVIFNLPSVEIGIPIGSLVPDSAYTVLQGPVEKYGLVWWEVDSKGLVGWVTEE